MHLAYASLCILCMFLCIAWGCGGRCGGVDGGEQVCPPLLRSETATTRPLRCCGFVSAVVQQRPASGQRIAGASTQATPTHAGHAVHAPDCVCVCSCVCSPPLRPPGATKGASCVYGVMCRHHVRATAASAPPNQPQVLHTPTANITDKTCLMPAHLRGQRSLRRRRRRPSAAAPARTYGIKHVLSVMLAVGVCSTCG